MINSGVIDWANPKEAKAKKVIVVTGGRDYHRHYRINNILTEIQPSLVVQGGARGADRGAEMWAQKNAVPCLRVPADWELHGKSAGPKRNGLMIDMAKGLAESMGAMLVVLAFEGGPGTANCVRCAKTMGIRTFAVYDRPNEIVEEV